MSIASRAFRNVGKINASSEDGFAWQFRLDEAGELGDQRAAMDFALRAAPSAKEAAGAAVPAALAGPPPPMALSPSSASPGEIAIIAYNTGQSDGSGNPPTVDALRFVALSNIAAGTVIYFTDRSWNGTVFAPGGSDGTATWTAPGGGVAAGTTINLTGAALGTLNPEEAGDTIYAYVGTTADAPTTFLYAIEIGDGNTTFGGSLVNTGLVNTVTAVAVGHDSSSYQGPTTEAYSHLYNNESLLENISDFTNWEGDNRSGGGVNPLDHVDHNGPYFTAPDFSIWIAAVGGGNAIASVHGDATVGSGATALNLAFRYTIDNEDLTVTFVRPADIVFDTARGLFFVADSNSSGGTNRIFQGNIADLIGNPGNPPTLTLLYTSNQAPGAQAQIRDLEVDPNNGIVYFTHGERFEKIVYNTTGQTSTVLANFETGNPLGGGNYFIDDFVINFATGTVYLSTHDITSAFDGDILNRNHLLRITGLDAGDGTNAFTFANTLLTYMNFSPDDDDAGANPIQAPGEALPQEEGTIEGLAISADGNTLYFTTASVLFDHDGDGGFVGDGNPGTTDPQLVMGGVFSYALTGNPTGTYTQIYQQVAGTGPQGLLDDIEIDAVTGHLYFTDISGLQIAPGNNPPGDEGIWRIAVGGGTPTFFQPIFNINSLGANNIVLNRAPNVLSSTQATPGVTEASSAPGSGLTALVQPFTALDVTDFDTADQTNQLAGAVVRISVNFQDGATHDDRLTINGLTSGTLDFGAQDITFSFNGATGAMTLTGPSTFNNYESAIALVRFNTSGDDPTAFGAATSRTIAWSVSDGLNHSEEVTTTISVTGINDAPVNTPGAAISGILEDTIGTAGNPTPPPVPRNAITGISVFDVDANPATQDIIVTLSVGLGTLTIRTDVTGGLAAGEVTGNGTGTLVLTGTQNQINATLAAVNNVAGANGLVYTPPANFNGATTLTITTNDQGFNGNDPGNSGTGTTEADTDTKIINITNVNDAPTVVDATQDATTITEDTPLAAGQTIASLFTASFDDALDQQQVPVTNPTGSVANTLGGIAIVAIDISGTTGRWQYFNGTWTDIPGGSPSAAFLLPASTAIRFNPALNFNGSAPALTALLVDSSGGTIAANGETVNLSGVGATGGDTRYSTGTVVLSQAVTAVNDAPVNTVPGTLNLSEDAVNVVVAGLQVNDVEAGPAGEPLTVTLSVTRGTITISTAVGGGIDATHVSGGAPAASNQTSITITATQAQINATLAGANGLTYTPTSNVNGNDTLTILTSDLGFTGTGGTLTDSDPRTLNVGAVNDAPTIGDGTESAVVINEDVPHTSGSAQTVAGLFGPQFSDATDQVAGGSSANGLLGIAIVVNGSNANGTWEWLNGAVWTAIGAASQAAAKTFDAGTQIRFNPALDFNGTAPTLTAHLVDNSSGTITNGSTVNLSAGGATGGTTRYSAGTVVLSQEVTSVNDAPIYSSAAPQPTYTENGAAVVIAGTVTVADDQANFLGGSLTIAITSGATMGDALGINTSGVPGTGIEFNGTDYSYNGQVIGSITGGTGTSVIIGLTVNATPVAIDALTEAFTALNVSEYPTSTARVVTFTLVDGGGGLDTTSFTRTISVVPLNDQPVVTVTSPLAVDEQIAEAIAPTGTLADLDLDARGGGLGDYSGSTLTIAVNGGATAQDVLAVVNGAGFVVNGGNLETSPGGLVFATVSGGSGAPLVISFTSSGTPATSALADAVLQAVQYTYTGDVPPASIQLDLTVNDGAPANADQGSVAGNPAAGTASITVNITNTPEVAVPVIVDLNGDTATSTEGGPTTALIDSGTAATITDADSPHFNGGNLTVSITANEVAAEDRLGIEPSATVTLSSGTDVGSVVSIGGNAIGTVTANGINGNDLVITFNTNDATPANVGLLLNAITYQNIQTFDPSTLTRTISVTVNDGIATSVPAVTTVSVVPQNDPPILDLDGPGGGGTATLNYAENAPATAIAPLAIRFDDTTNYDDGDLLIEMTNGILGEDVLSVIHTGNGPGEIGFSSGVISYGGVAIADLIPSPGALVPVLDIDFRPVTISAAAVEALMRAIGYNNTSDNPTVSPARSLTFSLHDGEGDANGGGHTGTQTATINITASNDAATITGTITGSVTEAGGINNGTPGTPTASADLGATDPDNTADSWQVVTTTPTLTGYGSYAVDAAGVWTYTLNDNNASVQALFGAATLNDTFNALTADGTSQTITITINAQDDAPTAQPDSFTITESGTIAGADLFANNGSGADSDPDSGGAITVSAVNGSSGAVNNTITLGSGALLTVNANGTFSYNPNNAFNSTPTQSSGAVNTPAPDSFTYTLTGGGTATVSLTITGVDSNDTLLGTLAANVLSGGIGNDRFLGLGGGDTLNGGTGNDLFIVFPGDIVNEALGEGTDTVGAHGNYQLAPGAEVEVLATTNEAGTGAIALTGNEFAQTIYGNAGNNVLTGLGGADTLIGGPGDDTYVVDNSDIVIEGAGGGFDTIAVSGSYQLQSGAPIEVLATTDEAGTGNFTLIGNAGNNVIYGNAGHNTIIGLGGLDFMVGDGGNDFYIVDSADDIVIEGPGGGTDTVATSVSYALNPDQEIELLATTNEAGTGALALYGNTLGQTIFGNAGNNWLEGRGGNDVLVGLGGADIYAFTASPGSGIVTITGFAAGSDKIALDDSAFGGLSADMLNFGAFRIGSAAQDADDRIIYDQSSGALYYDADGNGIGAAVQFAQFQSGTILTLSDFMVI